MTRISNQRPRSVAFRAAALVAACAAVIAALGAAWWLGMTQGRDHTAMAGHDMAGGPAAASSAPSPSAVDPGLWTVPQGEDATRRHLRDGLKAGDTDPVTARVILNYHDPMVPGKNFDAPAKSPFMDMMLVPRYAGSDAADASSVTVSPRTQQNLGLRTALVESAVLTLPVAAVGSVAWNERDQVLLQARATGFVEKLFVRATLDRVARGAPLAEIYVPAWVAAQEDYLALSRMTGPDLAELRDAARQRMQLSGMDAAQIASVVQQGKLQPRFTLVAPIGGVVTELALREGATVMPGMTLARIQGTATVWAEGELPESQAALLQPGTPVTATSPAVPGQRFEGRVQALLPAVDAATRTLKARLELRNPSGRLVPGMFVQMQFQTAARAPALVVPSEAVIRTGRRSVVMVAEDNGRFRPVEVTPGAEAGGRTEILEGLRAGDRVVLSGQFLIDSEASLRGLQARSGTEPAPGASGNDPTTTVYRTDAVVDDVEGDSATLTHPPIAALKWPAMTMEFKLPPPAERPRDLAKGQELDIEFRMQDGDMPLITRIERRAAGSGK